jgi:N-acyl-phosphatidylethanolamine-hydrolysing phospholipase D
MKKYNYLILLLLISALFGGCWAIRAGIRNIPDVIFSSSEKIPNKNTHPINDSVKFSALWVGHSTMLLQLYNKVILIDPLFNDVVGGLVLRKKEAGLDINSIPYLNLILVSHSHTDHLSLISLADLDQKFPSAKLIFPEGDEYYMPDYNMEMIRMRTGNSEKRNYTGETAVIDSVKITTVFASHFGGRFGLDIYYWKVPGCTGYIIEYKDICIFYAGDTMYDDKAYKYIGQKYKINLAIIPIGPCRDCNTVGEITHVASLGALMMFEDLNADFMIPVHYGAMSFTSDPDLPVHVLSNLIDGKIEGELPKWTQYKEKIKILSEGEQIIFK